MGGVKNSDLSRVSHVKKSYIGIYFQNMSRNPVFVPWYIRTNSRNLDLKKTTLGQNGNFLRFIFLPRDHNNVAGIQILNLFLRL